MYIAGASLRRRKTWNNILSYNPRDARKGNRNNKVKNPLFNEGLFIQLQKSEMNIDAKCYHTQHNCVYAVSIAGATLRREIK
jgi:tartrate dehydratase beta subunit/fumarate hydratase class I family protein